MSSLSFLSLHVLAKRAGIEPSRLQFILREFSELLPAQNGVLPESGLELVRRIHQSFFIESRPIPLIRRDLSGQQRKLRIIAVTSGKGGVGKTTVSINLAIALAGSGLRTLLFDADLGMANVHVYAGVAPRVTLLDVVEGRAQLNQALTSGPGNIQIICGASGVSRLADLDYRAMDFLGAELRRMATAFDVLVLDTGAGISAQVMQFLALADDVVVVATPNLAATLDAYGVVKAAHEAQLAAAMHVLVNQADDGVQADTVFTRISGCAERFLQITPGSLGSLRRDDALDASNQSRHPLLLAHPGCENSRRFLAIAAQLTVDLAPRAPHTPAFSVHQEPSFAGAMP
jgi:flagellar biosynthesis protein FlhG